jgi:hypothetical protein
MQLEVEKIRQDLSVGVLLVATYHTLHGYLDKLATNSSDKGHSKLLLEKKLRRNAKDVSRILRRKDFFCKWSRRTLLEGLAVGREPLVLFQ